MRRILTIITVIIFISFFLLSCGGYKGNSGTFIDKRDNQTYKWVRLGDQIWMAQNLNFEPEDKADGVSYGGRSSNSDKYGRLYHPGEMSKSDWREGYAPKDWHIASEKEWSDLLKYLGGEIEGVSKLIEGEFNAKFGGYGRLGTVNYQELDSAAYFWATSGSDYMMIKLTNDEIEFIPVSDISNDRHFKYSLRCVAD